MTAQTMPHFLLVADERGRTIALSYHHDGFWLQARLEVKLSGRKRPSPRLAKTILRKLQNVFPFAYSRTY